VAKGKTVERRASARYCVEVVFGLEALGGDTLIEGHVQDLSTRGMRAVVPSLLPEGGRAFAVITPPHDVPIVAMIEVLEQTVVAADAVVEFRAQFVDLSPANHDRLDVLCASGNAAPSS
jgi:PilZ domain-containing protein